MSHAEPTTDALLAHRPWVRALAHALVRDGASADDLEQEVWSAALARPPRADTEPRSWLGAVLRRRAARRFRDDARRARRERAGARPEAASDVADVVAAAETHRLVVNAVAALDELHRTAVLLRFFEGLPPAQIAARLGVSVETVRTRVRRGVARVRELLRQEVGGDEARLRESLLGLAFPPAGAGTGATSAHLPSGDAAPGPTAHTPRRAIAVAAGLALVAVGVAAIASRFGAPAPAPPRPSPEAGTAAAGDARRAPPRRSRQRADRAEQFRPEDQSAPAADSPAPAAPIPPADGPLKRILVLDGEGADAKPLGSVRVHVTGAGAASMHAATGDDSAVEVDRDQLEGERVAVVWASQPGRSFARREVALDGQALRLALPRGHPIVVAFRRAGDGARLDWRDVRPRYAAATFPERVSAIPDLGAPLPAARRVEARLDALAEVEFDLEATEEEDALSVPIRFDGTGAFRLVVTSPAGVPWVSPRLRLDDAGRAVVEVPATLEPASRRVRVLDAATGEPVARAAVGVLREADDGRVFERWAKETGDDGVVALPPAEDGVSWWVDDDVHVGRLDAPEAAARAASAGSAAARAAVRDVEIPAAAQVHGRATSDGSAVAAARVLLVQGPRRISTITDDAGEFTFEGVAAPAEGDAAAEVFVVLSERPLRFRRGTARVRTGAVADVAW